MRRNITNELAVTATAVMLAGCGSTPEHTNTLLFGTTTKFALDVSVNPAGGTPDFTLGYKRHEGVWMPLLANAKTGKTPEPASCTGTGCAFTGKETADAKEDTYSVLASFGAKFGGGAETSTSGEAPSAKTSGNGGLAQFFATGLAAQKLAEKDGARLVSLQPVDEKLLQATEEKAKQAIKQEEQLRKILGDQYEESYQTGVDSAKNRGAKKLLILQTIAPGDKLDSAKWHALVEKGSLENKEELKKLDLPKIKTKLEVDQGKRGNLINPLFEAI